MTPTGRNRLLEILMQGVRPALRGDEPEQTGEILPLARYENGGVFPAVPKFFGNALQALSTTGKDTFPETTVADSPQTIQDVLDYNNARRGMEGAIPLMGGGALGTAAGATSSALGASGGITKSGFKPLSQLLAEMGDGVSSNESVREGLMRTVLETEKLSANLSEEQKAKMLKESDDILDAVRRQMSQRRKDIGGVE